MRLKQIVLLFIYRSVIAPAGVLLAVTVGTLLIPKVREGLRLRRAKREWPNFHHRPTWIHASSGEFEYAKPLIREIKSRHPEMPVVVSYFSPSYAKAIQSFDGVDFSLPLPLDLPGPVREFFDRLNPQVGFIARTDLWPELLAQANENKTPLLLFSATQTRKPSFLIRWFDRWMWSYLKTILCVTDSDAANIRAIAPTVNALAIGDTRFDQVIERLRNPKKIKADLKPLKEKTLVAGSTWKEDEAALIPALSEMLQSNKLNLIIAPHEPTTQHIENLASQFKKFSIPTTLYSEGTNFTSGVLIIDKIGILAELYQWGALAFVGGSFKGSVHSVMEPLAAGAFTFVGPHYHNNREAIEFQQLKSNELSLVQAANNSSSLKSMIEQTLPQWNETHAANIRREIENRSGASRKLVEFLELRTNPIIPSATL